MKTEGVRSVEMKVELRWSPFLSNTVSALQAQLKYQDWELTFIQVFKVIVLFKLSLVHRKCTSYNIYYTIYIYAFFSYWIYMQAYV